MLGSLWWVSGDPGETPEQALRRELLEEISWQPDELAFRMVHHIHRCTAHVFRSELSVPLEQLRRLWKTKAIRGTMAL